MNRKIELKQDNILVKLLNKNNSDYIELDGIILPQTSNNKHLTQLMGEVQALGEYNKEPDGKRPFSVKVGDIVALEKSAGISVNSTSDDLLIIKESDILLILNKDRNNE